MSRKYLCLLFLVSACSLAPKYTSPTVDVPVSFKEEESQEDQKASEASGIKWEEAVSLEKNDRGQWWTIFNDEKLDALETEAALSNQSIKAIEARVAQARNVANASRADFFPSLDLGANAVRTKPSNTSAAAFGGGAGADLPPYTLYSAGGVISYEADLFGRVRDSYKAARLDADAQNAMYHSALLALQADVAQNYFALRTLDSEIKLLKETVDIRREAHRIMQKRFKEGDSGEQDKLRTQSELASVESDLIALQRQRATLEHALAVLLGKTPTQFTFEYNPLEKAAPPKIPAGLPSELLLRRPDVNAALAATKAANSRIGVARSAFFPSLTLSASGGYAATELSDLFKWSTHTWALGQVAGNMLSLPIFHGGRNKANLEVAKNAYDEAIANYRQQILIAFRDVEDNLVAQRLLAEQSVKQDLAANAATKTTTLSEKRYTEGETNYFEVVDSQRISLAAERAASQIRGQRFLTTISLVRALGGGWEENSLKQE